MVAYEKTAVVGDGGELRVRGLPLRPGQRVRVTVQVDDEERGTREEQLRALLRATQSLAHARDISEVDIATEVADCRATPP